MIALRSLFYAFLVFLLILVLYVVIAYDNPNEVEDWEAISDKLLFVGVMIFFYNFRLIWRIPAKWDGKYCRRDLTFKKIRERLDNN